MTRAPHRFLQRAAIRLVSALPHRLDRLALHTVLAVEDVLQATLVAVVSVRGKRRVTVQPFIGYGTPERVHVRGRIVLGTRAAREATTTVTVDPPAGPAGAGGGRRGRLRLGSWRTLAGSLAPFFTVELPRTRITVGAPAGDTTVRVDRQGYLAVPVDGTGLEPGWREVTVTASWRGHTARTPVPVLVVDPEARLALISDLDDTVIETGLTRGLEFLRITLLTHVTDRTPLPGAADLYQALTRPGPDGAGRPVFYLSTSPWNLYELLARFMVLRGFPTGPILLTDWGPSKTNWFRVTAEQHKLTLIRSLLAEHPGLSVLLVGDTGQFDPEIYAAVAIEQPDRVAAVYVRRTTNISAARAAEVEELARRVGAAGVPMLAVQDSLEIAQHAAGLGLLTDADVQAVRRATC